MLHTIQTRLQAAHKNLSCINSVILCMRKNGTLLPPSGSVNVSLLAVSYVFKRDQWNYHIYFYNVTQWDVVTPLLNGCRNAAWSLHWSN